MGQTSLQRGGREDFGVWGLPSISHLGRCWSTRSFRGRLVRPMQCSELYGHCMALYWSEKEKLSTADKMTIFSFIKNSETFICFVLLSIAFDLLASDGTLREFHSKTLDVADPLRNWRSVLLNSFTKTASSQAHQLASNKTGPEWLIINR